MKFSTMERYGRHMTIPSVGMAGQEKLLASKVTVVGMGGLGSPVIAYLAAAGVGTLRCIDNDSVDISNLQRQIVHSESDVGSKKVVSAESFISSINSSTRIEVIDERLDDTNCMRLLSNTDIVVDCTDNFPTRLLIDKAAVELKIPTIWGSVFRMEGQVSVFGLESGTHYKHLYPEAPPAIIAPSCAEAGVLGATCGVIGSLMSLETIRVVTTGQSPLDGRLAYFDGNRFEWNISKIDKTFGDNLSTKQSENNPKKTSVYEADPYTVQDTLIQSLSHADNVLLIDVREEYEYAAGHIEGAVSMPKSQILSVGEEHFKSAQSIIVYCRSGARSSIVADHLSHIYSGILINMVGGILAWKEQINDTIHVV